MSEQADFKDRDAFDESERELCADGNCTGLIGSDGKCKVCGLAADGSGTRRPSADMTGDMGGDSAGDASSDDDGPLGLSIEGDPDDRVLCPDGNCIGLIGSDGKCKVCGRSLAS